MKIMAIFDKKAECIVHVTLSPSLEVAKRDLILASESKSDLSFLRFPDDFSLLDISDYQVTESVDFTSFIKTGDDSNAQ